MRESQTLSWQDHARCIQEGHPGLWDGVRTSSSHYASRDFTEAKQICAHCPVSQLCLETALEQGDTECMRGGKHPEELKALLSKRIRKVRKKRVVRRTQKELVAA